MLQPKRTNTEKRRKEGSGRWRNVKQPYLLVHLLKALEPIWLNNRQIESAWAMTRAMKREGNVWIRIFR